MQSYVGFLVNPNSLQLVPDDSHPFLRSELAVLVVVEHLAISIDLLQRQGRSITAKARISQEDKIEAP